jgi:glyoxylase-like metal-dependent hydrolase (beta-lactamase superfamily II)
VHAYLQPDGSWGWSNAGLIKSNQSSLLIDTLFDLKLTREMLRDMDQVVGPNGIETVVNTHANGDHCWGNQLLRGARIVGSRATAEEMREGMQPELLAGLVRQSTTAGALGLLAAEIFGSFDFSDIVVVPPESTFDGELTLHAGDREVQLFEVGPAHTRGDTLVWLPRERVLFTGDIVFNGSHPVVWAGPVSNWVAALDRVIRLEPEVLVPGHGPIGDISVAVTLKSYFEELSSEVKRRVEAGLHSTVIRADLKLAGFEDWGEPERLAANVEMVCRELNSEPPATSGELMAAMAESYSSLHRPG